MKKCQKVRKSAKNYETILPFSCCPLVFPSFSVSGNCGLGDLGGVWGSAGGWVPDLSLQGTFKQGVSKQGVMTFAWRPGSQHDVSATRGADSVLASDCRAQFGLPSTRRGCRICMTVRLPARPRGETMYWQANANTPLSVTPLLNVPYKIADTGLVTATRKVVSKVEGSRSHQRSATALFQGTKAPKTLVLLCFGAIREGQMVRD